MKKLIILIMFVGLGLNSTAEDRPIAIRNARLLTVSHGEITSGTILFQSGKIVAVGKDVTVPDGAEIIEANGYFVTPGLIDSHSHLGLGPSGGITEDNEMSDPVTPQLRIIDSIHPSGMEPHKNSFMHALEEGVTTVIARPGSGNVIGGQSAALKLLGKTVDDMLLVFPCDMKMAMGRKAYGAKGMIPVTKMGTAYLVRKTMIEAAEYQAMLERYDSQKQKKPDTPAPKRNLQNEAMVPVLNRKLPVHIHASGVDDIMTALRLSDEFDFFKLSIGHGDEAYKIAPELAKRNVVVVVGPQMIVYDDYGKLINLADFLVKNGVEVCIMTDADVVQQEFLRFQAALAVKYGMNPDEALKAITLNPAKLIGMEKQIGTLEPGKDADLVVFDGDPFSVQTRAVYVFINGKKVVAPSKIMDKQVSQ